eukprot:910204-Alexandrium_andersonii.AAC.1
MPRRAAGGAAGAAGAAGTAGAALLEGVGRGARGERRAGPGQSARWRRTGASEVHSRDHPGRGRREA